MTEVDNMAWILKSDHNLIWRGLAPLLYDFNIRLSQISAPFYIRLLLDMDEIMAAICLITNDICY